MTWFEEFRPGERMRHARGTTVGEVENQLLTKLVLNTSQAHFNEHAMAGSPLGEGRLVFGLVTGSIVIGLATQDTAEHALAEVGLDRMRFTAPVHHGDTLYAESTVLEVRPSESKPDRGVVRVRTDVYNQENKLVASFKRAVLVPRRLSED